MVFGGEGTRKEGLPVIVRLEGFDGVIFGKLEGQNKIGFETAGKLAGDNAGISAVGAACRGGRGIADELCAAGRAGIAFQSLCVRAPVVVKTGRVPIGTGAFAGFFLLFFSSFLCFGGFLLFFGVERFNLGDIER